MAELVAVPVSTCTPYGKVNPTTIVVFVVVAVVWPAAPLTASSKKIARINIELQGACPSNRKFNGITPAVAVTRVKLLIALGITFPRKVLSVARTRLQIIVEGRRKGRWSAKVVCGIELSEMTGGKLCWLSTSLRGDPEGISNF